MNSYPNGDTYDDPEDEFEEWDDACVCPHCGSMEDCDYVRCAFCGGRMDGMPMWLDGEIEDERAEPGAEE